MTIQVTVSLFLVFTAAAFCKRIKIVGGTFSLIRDCPYLASLRYIPNNEHVCAATILTPQHILTAAHCVQESFINFLDLKVLTGTSDVFIHEGNSYLLEKYFIYPEFSAQLNDKIVHYLDIAIVKIFGFIEFNEYQKKINLPTRNVLPADFGILSGWGALTYPSNGASNILQKAWMTVVDNNYCKNYVPFYINSDQFCAFQKKSVGPCIGDGGSPLVGSNDTILGILSVSIPCAIGIPDLYTNVYSHLTFIRSIIGS